MKMLCFDSWSNQDGVETGGRRKFLDEIHGDGIPGSFRDRKLLQKSIGSMTLWFGSHTSGA